VKRNIPELSRLDENLRKICWRNIAITLIEVRNRCRRQREDWSESLLDRHRLGQISRLIYVAAAADGDVIGEQLQRDDLQNRG
jgi:hypothetical protein